MEEKGTDEMEVAEKENKKGKEKEKASSWHNLILFLKSERLKNIINKQ